MMEQRLDNLEKKHDRDYRAIIMLLLAIVCEIPITVMI